MEQAELISKFLTLIANKEYDTIEKMVYAYPFLEESDDYKRLKEEIDKKIREAEKKAFEGELDQVAKILGELLNSEIYRNKIKNIIKAAYLNQLLKLLVKVSKDKKHTPLLIRGVNNYVAYFGFDNEVEDIINKAKKIGVEVELKSMEPYKKIDYTKLPKYIWEA